MTHAYPPEVLAASVSKLTMLGIAAAIAAILFSGF
jgi:hypothetical protein